MWYIDNNWQWHVYDKNSITSSVEANISDILKVDGGDGVSLPGLYHAASQAPVLGVRAELQDLVIVIIVTILATWI